MSNKTPPAGLRFWSLRSGIVFLVFIGIGGFLMYHEHRAHIPGGFWLLIGLLGACVLMHVFMHGGHGHGQSSDTEGE